MIHQNVLTAIGNTPLIKLEGASRASGCTILGKAEWMNPGGSVKDRAALAIIEDAEAKGLLTPGATIVEGTAGNTGIGLTMVAKAKGYNAKIVIPRTQSEEKKAALRSGGADLIEVDAVPYKDPNNYVKFSGRLAEEMNAANPGSALWANQFDNIANRQGHIDTTAPEIWAQTEGKIDGFICAVGTGGTLAGCAMGLRAKNPDIKIAIADPHGAALHSFYTTGELKSEGGSITEGIGQGRITGNLDSFTPDMAFRISDTAAMEVVFDLIQNEGIALGGSAGLNVAGAIEMGKAMGPGHTIVTILCDGIARYASKMMNVEFLTEKGLPTPDWMV